MDKICCNICNKKYSPKYYMTHHKKTVRHIENAYEYNVEEIIEENFEDHFNQTNKYKIY